MIIDIMSGKSATRKQIKKIAKETGVSEATRLLAGSMSRACVRAAYIEYKLLAFGAEMLQALTFAAIIAICLFSGQIIADPEFRTFGIVFTISMSLIFLTGLLTEKPIARTVRNSYEKWERLAEKYGV